MLTSESILESLARCVDSPVSEVFVPGFDFCDYRLAFGVRCYEPTTVYFLAIYPAFCLNAKAVFHYNALEALKSDLNGILDFMSAPQLAATKTQDPASTLLNNAYRKIQTRDIIAAVFALSRNKESVELFQEQKDFMELGVRHVHLDNYYQDFIKTLCTEYFKNGTIIGVPLTLSFISRSK